MPTGPRLTCRMRWSPLPTAASNSSHSACTVKQQLIVDDILTTRYHHCVRETQKRPVGSRSLRTIHLVVQLDDPDAISHQGDLCVGLIQLGTIVTEAIPDVN